MYSVASTGECLKYNCHANTAHWLQRQVVWSLGLCVIERPVSDIKYSVQTGTLTMDTGFFSS